MLKCALQSKGFKMVIARSACVSAWPSSGCDARCPKNKAAPTPHSHRRRNRQRLSPPLSHSSSTVSHDDLRLSLLLRSGYEHSTLSQPHNHASSDPLNGPVLPRQQLISTIVISTLTTSNRVAYPSTHIHTYCACLICRLAKV